MIMDFEHNRQTKVVQEGEKGTKQECVEIDFGDSDEYNIQNLCRICLSAHNKDMFPLFGMKDNETLPEMFTSFTAIEINPEDGLPLHICGKCKDQVINCYEFKIKCLNADCTLKSLLKGNFDTKEPCDQKISLITVDLEDIGTEYDNKDVKFEDLSEDIQYLEDFSDAESDSLCIVQSTKKQKKKDIHVSFTDLNIILNESTSKQKTSDKKKKHYYCDICSKKFVKLKAFRIHMSSGHSSVKDPYSCKQCKETFSSDHDLKLHGPLHSKGPVWTCIQCKKEFKVRAMMRRHVLRHMERKRYACDACGKPFAELYALRRHSRVHTGERVEKRHQCTLCDKRYSEQGLLAAHMARHSGERPCVCAACGKAFPSARLLASHHLTHTNEKPHACAYCDKRFRHESTRNTHHRTHTGEKPYVCATCGKAFIQNSNLTLHMRTHTGERPYSCETCGRKFSSGSTLKSHARTHTGEKPYSCDVCGKKFARKAMGAHRRLHSGERPFACGACAARFASAARLRDHTSVHTGEKPYECSVCTMKFSTKSHLMKHFKTHKTKKKPNRELVVRRVDCEPHEDKYVITKDTDNYKEQNSITEETDIESANEIIVDEEPLEISGELVLQDEVETKNEVVVVDDIQSSVVQEAVCLNSNSDNYINDITYGNDVNLVTVNEGEMSIASSAMLEGTTVKLYQLDQSLVQIHTTGSQVTISKITSKMTANF